MFKMKKVFDCQEMPDDVRKAFFNMTDYYCGNDIYVDWGIASDTNPDTDIIIVDKWLIENGADGSKDNQSAGEEVLVKRWW